MSRWTRPREWAASSAWADLVDDRRRLPGIEPALVRDQLAQVGVLDVAHRDEELAVLLARVVDRQDVRLVERGSGPRLALEALAEVRVVGVLARDQLERDDAAEREVGGAVDDAHAAPPRDFLDSVSGELGAARKICHVPLYIAVQPRRAPLRRAWPIFRERESQTGSAIAVGREQAEQEDGEPGGGAAEEAEDLAELDLLADHEVHRLARLGVAADVVAAAPGDVEGEAR